MSDQNSAKNTAEKFDKIRIILIDDNPESLSLDDANCDMLVPALDSENSDLIREDISDYFDLKWFSSCEEVREYRDSIRLLAYKSPATLLKEKLIGELLFFDYAMTKDPRPVVERYPKATSEEIIQKLCLLPKIRDIRKRLAISLNTSSPLPVWNGGVNNDDQGCFAGGLLFSLLAYPCAPVALTRKMDVSSEVEFFEWMLEKDANNAFSRRGRPVPKWDDLIVEGVRTLRKRIEELACAGLISISLKDLMALVESKKLYETLTFNSRYGNKTLPINGLFIDFPQDGRLEEARKWAEGLLNKLLGGYKLEDIKKGIEFADKLFEAYTNEPLRKQRYLLSIVLEEMTECWLTSKSVPIWVSDTICDLGNGDSSKGEGIFKKYMGEYIDGLPKKGKNIQDKPILNRKYEDWCRDNPKVIELEADCMKNWLDLRSPDYTDSQKRWAILFMIVKLHKFRWDALHNIINQFGKLGIRMVYSYLSKKYTDKGIYDATYPLPATPLILPDDPTSAWPLPMLLGGKVEKDKKKSTYGILALKYDDILESKDWTDDPDYPDNKGANHGFMTGERTVLIMYANSLSNESNWDWEKDDDMRKILKPEVK